MKVLIQQADSKVRRTSIKSRSIVSGKNMEAEKTSKMSCEDLENWNLFSSEDEKIFAGEIEQLPEVRDLDEFANFDTSELELLESFQLRALIRSNTELIKNKELNLQMMKQLPQGNF